MMSDMRPLLWIITALALAGSLDQTYYNGRYARSMANFATHVAASFW